MNHPVPPPHARGQRGAALFVALMLLVIVSILGVSVAQVTALQERMASNYRVDDLAFQSADGFLRARELDISARLSADKSADCRPDPSIGGANMIPTWKEGATVSESAFESMQGDFGAGRSSGMVGNLDTAIGEVSAGSWQCLMFRVAAVGVGVDDEDAADASARTIVQSTYILE
ncbi:pilus assembly PilX family protein [Chiayiivirga flava]|uniref:Type IV pilus assembly protein PilX n=1 Tax=Chiayiivirga flava TaxID=659595 RepID=A0A7W8D7I9_9GAMM|nr:PilX N-terminal domain-containing pilus assembly protein [Chiayiivirga flava]MBB5209369.1 type IV pilus assembly protein PilX [Chiayiivirga flava]